LPKENGVLTRGARIQFFSYKHASCGAAPKQAVKTLRVCDALSRGIKSGTQSCEADPVDTQLRERMRARDQEKLFRGNLGTGTEQLNDLLPLAETIAARLKARRETIAVVALCWQMTRDRLAHVGERP
jgi:hypothetical protein